MARMAEPAQTLHDLYEAFSARDGEAMARCYTPDATFEDPVFRLSGRDVGDMWRMLTSRGEGSLRIAYDVKGGEDRVAWTADYIFEGHPGPQRDQQHAHLRPGRTHRHTAGSVRLREMGRSGPGVEREGARQVRVLPRRGPSAHRCHPGRVAALP
jgi:hypothetical protein